MDRVRQWLKLDELLEKERQASLPWARSAEGQKSLGGGGGREAVDSVELRWSSERILPFFSIYEY
jgi:hypothetical protein